MFDLNRPVVLLWLVASEFWWRKKPRQQQQQQSERDSDSFFGPVFFPLTFALALVDHYVLQTSLFVQHWGTLCTWLQSLFIEIFPHFVIDVWI